jgi:zinc protease
MTGCSKVATLALCLGALLILPARPLRAQHGDRGAVPEDERQSELGRAIDALPTAPLAWRVPAIGREVERLVLANGLTVFLYSEPSDEVDALIDRLAARVGLGAEQETAGGTLRCLAGDAPAAIELLADLLRRPLLPEEKLALIKKAERESILRQKDQPGFVAGTLFQHQLYGEHPLGRILRLEAVESVTRADLAARHARFYVPERTFIGVAGDFSRDAMLALLERAFGDWPRGTSALPTPPRVDRTVAAPGLYHFQKSIPQSTVRLGHLGVARGDPDEFPIRVMNFILGGQGFRSRLGERVRSDEGLAYAVSSRYALDTPDVGVFEARTETKAASTYRAVAIMAEEIRGMQTAPPDDYTVVVARESIANSFIHRWTNPVAVLEQLMDLEITGREPNYYETYLERLRAVTAADVQRAAREHLDPDRLVTVVVGDGPAMGEPPAGSRLVPLTLPPEYRGEKP